MIMLGRSENAMPQRLPNGNVKCHECGGEFDRISAHWSRGSCEFPEVPAETLELLEGLLMGDATLRRHTKIPFVQIYMINEEFIEWLDEEFGWLSTGWSLYRTAEHSAELGRSNGSNPIARAANYNDVYQTQTRSMPQFEQYREWYPDGEKRFPADLELTPMRLKCWYVCDGTLNHDPRYPNARPYITISMYRHMDQVEEILAMFEATGLDLNPQVDEKSIRFRADDSETLLTWMGYPLPGFEYKWARTYPQYMRLKGEVYQTDVPWVGDIDVEE